MIKTTSPTEAPELDHVIEDEGSEIRFSSVDGTISAVDDAWGQSVTLVVDRGDLVALRDALNAHFGENYRDAIMAYAEGASVAGLIELRDALAELRDNIDVHLDALADEQMSGG